MQFFSSFFIILSIVLFSIIILFCRELDDNNLMEIPGALATLKGLEDL